MNLRISPQRLSLVILMVCSVIWLLTYFSLNAAEEGSPLLDRGATEFQNSFQELDYARNLTIQLEKQREQISFLQMKVKELERRLASSSTNSPNSAGQIPGMFERTAVRESEETLLRIKNATNVVFGAQMNNEYELVPFVRFTEKRLYLVEPGLGRRVIEKPIGYVKRDLMQVVEFAARKLNEDRNNRTSFSSARFLEGIYRTLPGIGTHYELYFKPERAIDGAEFVKVVLTRQLTEPSVFQKTDVNIHNKLINIIVPLSGRIDSFKRFMDNFVKVCIHHDKYVYLTVVYFGKEGSSEIQSTVGNISLQNNFNQIQLILLDEPFSRSKGIQVGVQNWTQTRDVLLFVCDVDVAFNTDFLDRCRLNAESGRKVYYPIVFSLYNPKIVYALQEEPIPAEGAELVMSKETGFWRDFGYGMTCQYRQDFLRMKGFDEQILGWGTEDVYLYRKYIRSKLLVIRATDPGIFHIWHEKYCDPKLSPDQYNGCIRSKALNEASHSQLGILAFKDEIDIHKAMRNKG